MVPVMNDLIFVILFLSHCQSFTFPNVLPPPLLPLLLPYFRYLFNHPTFAKLLQVPFDDCYSMFFCTVDPDNQQTASAMKEFHYVSA